MTSIRKRLIVVGDRLLIRPEQGEDRTKAGLYLPASVQSVQDVQGGRVMEVGPGLPVANPTDYDEPWKKRTEEPRYVPLQARVGDYALFLQKASVEITFEKERYLIVPNSAVLVLVRDEIQISGSLAGLGEVDPED